jgi:hypothetical protein
MPTVRALNEYCSAGTLPPRTRRCQERGCGLRVCTSVRRDVASGFSLPDPSPLDYCTARLTQFSAKFEQAVAQELAGYYAWLPSMLFRSSTRNFEGHRAFVTYPMPILSYAAVWDVFFENADDA